MTKAPVLLMTFNRPNTTKQVLGQIAQYRPEKIYIASDGPRQQVVGEKDTVEKLRQFLLENVNWGGEIKTLFRPTNLGCKIAVSEAISWFFEHEESGIILEDDCVPDLSFFTFCALMLATYKNDERVMQVSGTNFIGQYTPSAPYQYFFSKYGGIWGWASWRRAWQHFDLSSKRYLEAKDNGILKGYLGNAYGWRMSLYKQVFERNLDTWDYQWSFARAINSGLSVVPAVNLIRNIGFDTDATHTRKKTSALDVMKIGTLDVQDIHVNPFIVPDRHYDAQLVQKLSGGLYRIKPFIRKLKDYLSPTAN